MSKVSLIREFTIPLHEVRAGFDKLGQGLQEEHGMKYRWEGDDRISFHHKAAKGFIEIQGNKVVLELKLGMLYVTMAPIIRKRLTEFADEHLG